MSDFLDHPEKVLFPQQLKDAGFVDSSFDNDLNPSVMLPEDDRYPVYCLEDGSFVVNDLKEFETVLETRDQLKVIEFFEFRGLKSKR
jgi:hypothetical protein